MNYSSLKTELHVILELIINLTSYSSRPWPKRNIRYVCSYVCVLHTFQSGNVEYIALRSIGSQTENDEDDNPSETETSKDADGEDEDVNCISSTEFREILFHRINCKSESSGTTSTKAPLDLTLNQQEEVDAHAADETVVTSSSEESESEPEVGQLFENLNVANAEEENRTLLARFDITALSAAFALFFSQCRLIFRAIRCSRSRMFLTLFWFLYGGIIVYISRSFLPWMSFYTVIYFVIIYAELNPPGAFA